MMPVYLLLAVLVAMMAYVIHKLRLGVSKTYRIQAELDDLRRYDLTALAREIQAHRDLVALLDLQVPLPPLGGWAASADFLLEVSRCARDVRPAIAVELGSGASTVVLGRVLQQLGGGHLYSLDHDARFAAQTRRLVDDHGLRDYVTVLHAPLSPSDQGAASPPWYALDDLPLGDIDLLIVDGPPETVAPLARYPAGPRLLPRLAPGGVVLVDDSLRADEREMVRRWQAEFPDLEVAERPSRKGCTILSRPAAAAA